MGFSKVDVAGHRQEHLSKLIKIGSSAYLMNSGNVFALAYHSFATVAFYFAGIKPLFYFNVFSVLLYGLLLINHKNNEGKIWPYLCGFVEVLVHQILATYLLGSEPAFFFLILPIGVMGMLILDHQFWSSVATGFVAMVIFVFIYIFGPYIDPVYNMEPVHILLFRILNVFSGIMMLFWGMFAFTVRSAYVSDQLALQVRNKSKELNDKNHKVSEMQKHMISSLANLVEDRDEDTGKHIFRTGKYVEMIAVQAMRKGYYVDEIDGKFVENISKAAPLHDIGKITVPDQILKKPGRLTAQEYELMKKHSEEGARIVANILRVSDDKDYVDMAVNIAVGHHEKWDGSGYPMGLAGEEIPLCARIMAIADVFDALISTRCYKQAMPYDKAFAIIEEERGKHFDPILVDVFLSMKDRIIDAD